MVTNSISPSNSSRKSLTSESLDVAFFSQSLHHLENHQKGLHETARILRKGGQVLVMELASHKEEWVIEKLGHKWLGFKKEFLIDSMKSAGLINLYFEVLPHRREELFQIILSAGCKQ